MLIQARRGRIGRGLDAVELAIIVQSGIDRGEIVFRLDQIGSNHNSRHHSLAIGAERLAP